MNEYLSFTTRVKILLGRRELLLSINSCQGRRVACSNRGINNQSINTSINQYINQSINNQSIQCWVEGNCCYLISNSYCQSSRVAYSRGVNQFTNQSINYWVEGKCCYLLVIARVVELPTVGCQLIYQSINQSTIN